MKRLTPKQLRTAWSKGEAPARDWEVIQRQTIVCSGITEIEAHTKVDNEKRLGWHMTAQPATPKPETVFDDYCED